MRLASLFLMLAGLAAGIVYPAAMQWFGGSELGRWPVFERGAGFRPVTVTLSPSDAPVRVIAEMVSTGGFVVRNGRAVLTLTVAADGRTVLAETIDFVRAEPREQSPQSTATIYGDVVGTLRQVDAADHVFTFGQGDTDDIPMQRVDLVLRAGARDADARIPPVGFIALAIGAVGFINSFRRRQADDQPPAPKWGR